MLVLSRNKNESIRIGDDVTVTVVEMRGDKVRLGIEAPRTLPVHRQEVYQQIDHKTKTTLVPLPLTIAETVERQASLAGMSQEHFLSLVVGLGLAACNQTSSEGGS